MSQVTSFEQFVVQTADQIGVSLANEAVSQVKNAVSQVKNYDEFGEDPDFAEIASALADNLVETEREAVTEFAAQVVKAEDADEGDADADDEVQDYTNALLEGLAEVAVEWLTAALYCHYMERDDLVPHENLLAAAVTGVFVAELNVEDDGEDDDEESAPEVEDDEDDDDQYQ
jgi:hypothetical protein